MSKEDKIKRAEDYTKNNQEILAQIKKLCNQYQHNFTCAKNLYKKAQVDIPSDYKYGYGYISIEID